MNASARLRSIALVLAQQALHRKGYVVRKSRAGVQYIVPFSRCAHFIQDNDPRYTRTPRGYFVRAEV